MPERPTTSVDFAAVLSPAGVGAWSLSKAIRLPSPTDMDTGSIPGSLRGALMGIMGGGAATATSNKTSCDFDGCEECCPCFCSCSCSCCSCCCCCCCGCSSFCSGSGDGEPTGVPGRV